MKNLFLTDDCIRNGSVILSGKHLHYLKNVRRVRTGDHLSAVIGRRRYQLKVSSITRNSITLKIEDERRVQPADLASISVYQGLLKGRKMDRVVASLAELGVYAFIPLITERCVPSESGPNRIERWKRLASEGAKVSGHESLLNVSSPLSLTQALKGLNKDENGVIIIFCVENFQFHLTSYLKSLFSTHAVHMQERHYHLFFGPEGGFSAQEVEVAGGFGGIPVSMGPFVLKSDTAAIVSAGFIRLYCTY